MEFSCLHDLHCHTVLSSCCHDARMTAEAVFSHAAKAGYDTQCVTDHLWDESVPGASPWYRPQDIPHVTQNLPLPSAPLRALFGCETEFLGGARLGLSLDRFDLFDFVAVPINHTHMKGFVRPQGVDTEEKMARLLTERLEDLCRLPLPFSKIGVAHLTGTLMFEEGDVTKIYSAMEERRLMKCFDFLARKGAGIELNAGAFPEWEKNPGPWLRLYRLAKKAGCRFYLASDAHTVDGLDGVTKRLPPVVRALELTEADRYLVP